MTDLNEIRKRAAAATPGPWVWRGNMDHEDPRLVGRNRIDEDGKRQFPGMVEVLWSYPRDREATDRGADDYREYLQDTRIEDPPGSNEFRRYTDDEIEERVRENWLTDAWGEPIRENRMCFTTEHMTADDARELAVFEVARAQNLPDDTPRTHKRVYRADIVDVRHPDAEFIAHSRSDVDTLLAALNAAEGQRDDNAREIELLGDRLRGRIAALEAERDRAVALAAGLREDVTAARNQVARLTEMVASDSDV